MEGHSKALGFPACHEEIPGAAGKQPALAQQLFTLCLAVSQGSDFLTALKTTPARYPFSTLALSPSALPFFSLNKTQAGITDSGNPHEVHSGCKEYPRLWTTPAGEVDGAPPSETPSAASHSSKNGVCPFSFCLVLLKACD